MLSAAKSRLPNFNQAKSLIPQLNQLSAFWLLIFSAAAAIAIIAGNFASSLSALARVALALFIGAGSIFLSLRSHKSTLIAPKTLKLIALAAIGGLVGTVYVFLAWQRHLNCADLDGFVNKTVAIEGYIVGLPKLYKDYAQFNFKLQQVKQVATSHTIQLNWYFKNAAAPTLVSGAYWRFNAKLRPPVAPLNPGGLDREKLWASQGVQAIGTIISYQDNLAKAPHPLQAINRFRQAAISKTSRNLIISEAILKRLMPAWLIIKSNFDACRAIILSLVLGYRQDLDQTSWRVISFAGIGHLLAISGLHISLIAQAIKRLTKLLVHPKWLIYVPRPKIAAVTSFIFSIGYALITGWSIATERALGMLLLQSLATLYDRKITSLSCWGLTLILVLMLHPLAPLQVGFWLSFSASLLMILFGFWQSPSLEASRARFKLFWLQLRLFLTLTPLNFSFFQKTSVVSILVNLVAIPTITMLVLPMAILGFVLQVLKLNSLAVLVYALPLEALQLLWQLVSVLALKVGPIFTLSYGFSNLPLMFLAVFTALITLGFYRLSVFRLGWVAAALLVFSWPSGGPQRAGEFYAHVIDVGQGLAVLVKTQHHAMLFDTGPSSLNSDSAKRHILPFMLEKQFRKLDMLVVSHSDNDHAGGAKSIIKHFKPRKILTSTPQTLKLNAALTVCKAGQRWLWDGVTFNVLHPDLDTLNNPNTSANNGSCVVKVSGTHQALLLTGDIEKASEHRILERLNVKAKEVLHSDVLIAPHHGSKTSSTARFIQNVNPKLVVFTTSYRNRFRFPNVAVLERYRTLLPGAKLYNSAYTGAITLKFTKKALIAKPFRQTSRRLWRAFSAKDAAQLVAW